MYWPVFLVRRIAYVCIPLAFPSNPFPQVILLLVLCTTYVGVYFSYKPHFSPIRTRIEIFNEVMIIALSYHLLCFSDFVDEPGTLHILGISYDACLGLVLLVNIGAIIKERIRKIIKKRKKEKDIELQEA